MPGIILHRGAPLHLHPHLHPHPHLDASHEEVQAGGEQEGRQAGETLVEMNLLPSLKKTSEAVGEKVQVPGAYWEGCPPADLDKIYLCTVIRFEATHTFHGGLKSAAFIMQEMGESGEGSLEPGDSSGEVFPMMYPHIPQPFGS